MMQNYHQLITQLYKGDLKALARAITIVENELSNSNELLFELNINEKIPVIGITGPPGAGKSTLLNALIKKITAENKKVGVVAVDPTSPFNYGSLLGDRLRMAEHFNNENVFIRSLATRGSLGGLSAKIIEVIEVMRAFTFDYIFIETVGVGQSEVEIAGLADTTVLVLVPEAGDEVQTLKSGIMEIADIFVVNKADREGADLFVKNLLTLVHSRLTAAQTIAMPVIKTTATLNNGADELYQAIRNRTLTQNPKRFFLLAEKAYHLIQNYRMQGVDKQFLKQEIEKAHKIPGFTLYKFVKTYLPIK
jgi:LAO/AO transport system kinase